LGKAVERNNESLTELSEGFHHLRGEMNGILPRLEGKVERIIGQLESREKDDREYFEKVRVHDQQITSLVGQVEAKADGEANRDEHGRLWLAIRIFFYGTLAALIGILLKEVMG
jgi:hypothetical protein